MGDSMSTIINATTTNGVVIEPDNSGSLVLQTNSGTTAVTVDTSQNTTFAGKVTSAGDLILASNGTTTAITIDTSQRAAFVAGTAALPAITTTGDTNTGMWFPAADTIAFAEGGAEAMRIDSSGNLLVGATGAAFTEKFLVRTSNASGNSATFTHDNSANNSVVITYHAGSDGATSRKHFSFRNLNTTEVGSISCTGSATAFTTSSDYRLKENIAPMTGALATVAQLKPVTYTWKADGFSGQGFIAHELAEVVPDCVTGEKDAIDTEGNPEYQGVDTSFLVATLTAAIQELKAIVDAQAIRIETLEAKLG
jgi:hypothetical protein